ncbi:MAG: hypothetical protein V2I34_00515 [Bacteroidales bacterium]|jgi:hypothetical protein|nr:hypothetical protein [Bacteroidales bacterium]
MMKESDKLIRQLRMYRPEIAGREELKESILQKTVKRTRQVDYIFGWTEIGWLRRSLSVASILIIGLFVGQQLFVIDRINKIEERMVSFNTDKILQFQRENVILNSLILEDPEVSHLADSISVSTYDLMQLLRDYRELQYKYEKISRSGTWQDPEKQEL